MCNAWCVDFIRTSKPWWPSNPDILEVGSLNVNGSPRDAFPGGPHHRYVGIDLVAGFGVDRVMNVEDLPSSDLPPFDVVLCTEMLEHAHDWKRAILVMMGALNEGGVLVLTTRSPGFEIHPYPEDNWRFTAADFAHLFNSDVGDEPFELVLVELDPDKRNGVSCGVGIVVLRKRGSLALLRERLERQEVLDVHTGKRR